VARKIAKPRPQKKASVEPAPTAADRGGKLTVQAASLPDLDDAEALVRRLKAKGYPAFKTMAKIPQRGIWFRVRVGRFRSEKEAGAMMKKLEAEGFDPLLVRQD